MTAEDYVLEELVWCPGCDFEARTQELPLVSITLGTCPNCQSTLHTLPKNATDEYREYLRRF